MFRWLQNQEASCGEQLPLDYRVARARNLMGVQGVDRRSGSWDLSENDVSPVIGSSVTGVVGLGCFQRARLEYVKT
jgi:hypothetical protein